MALYYDLKVFQDVYHLILKVFEFTKNFPMEYKFTLGQDMKRDAIVLVCSIYRANKAKTKTEYLFPPREVSETKLKLPIIVSYDFMMRFSTSANWKEKSTFSTNYTPINKRNSLGR